MKRSSASNLESLTVNQLKNVTNPSGGGNQVQQLKVETIDNAVSTQPKRTMCDLPTSSQSSRQHPSAAPRPHLPMALIF